MTPFRDDVGDAKYDTNGLRHRPRRINIDIGGLRYYLRIASLEYVITDESFANSDTGHQPIDVIGHGCYAMLIPAVIAAAGHAARHGLRHLV